MFDEASRYFRIETATFTLTDPDGTPRQVVYKRRRFVPQPNELVAEIEHPVSAGERPDTIAARYFGDSNQFHVLCDANNVLDPNDLLAEIGRRLKIAQNRF